MLENTLEAASALQAGDRPQAVSRFQDARAAMARVRAGQGLTSRPPWQNWYRGDRRMNLAGAEQMTEALLAELNKPKGE